MTLFCVARQARSYSVGPTGLGEGVWGLRSQMTMFVAGRRVPVCVCLFVFLSSECFAYIGMFRIQTRVFEISS